MFKLIRLSFYLCLVFVGLYFFGDFRINDTHVKSYLQETVTIQTVTTVKNQVVRIFDGLIEFFEGSKEVIRTAVPDKKVYTPSSHKATTLITKPKPNNIPLDDLSKKDRDRMLNILKDNIKP